MIDPHTTLGQFPSVDAAWRAIVRTVFEHGTDTQGTIDPNSIGSSFGKHSRPFREIIGAHASILSPRNRLVDSHVRSINFGYLLANFIWTIVGSDDLESIAFYNSRGRDFSDNHRTLEAAPGKRIFKSVNGDQFTACAELLSKDPSSRRAVITFSNSRDAGSFHRDCSCVLTMQFLRRENRLHCIASMRSQSALMVFPYDAFLLTMLHECMACAIGSELGLFHLFFGSLHYYLDESQSVSRFLDEPPPITTDMPAMTIPATRITETLLRAEKEIREHATLNSPFDLDHYWSHYLHGLHKCLWTKTARLETCAF